VVFSPAEPGTKNDRAGEGRQQFARTKLVKWQHVVAMTVHDVSSLYSKLTSVGRELNSSGADSNRRIYASDSFHR
jgi:hypothetical protein